VLTTVKTNLRQGALSMTSSSVTPQVSVVVPAYNSAGVIARTLDSVFRQTFTKYEVIVVNDGSPDTRALTQALAPYLRRIQYIQQYNRGPSGARNTGILRAKGEFVAFLDSDDFWLPHHLENQIKLLKMEPGLGLVYANPMLMDGTAAIGSAFALASQESTVTFESLVRETSRISTSSVVASRNEILQAGLFDESMRRCEDFDLWLRMSHRGCRMAFSSDVQLYHHRANGLSSNRLSMKSARIAVYQKVMQTLPLTAEQRRTLNQRAILGEAEYQVELAKAALLDKNYAVALTAAERASGVIDNWKLRAALTGLRTAPGLLQKSYRAYEQILDVRNRSRTAKRSKQSMSPDLPTAIRLPA
jgi:GT2 family glycosyltransferase